MDGSIYDLIDSADAEGFVTLSVDKRWYDNGTLKIPKGEGRFARKLLEAEFVQLPLFALMPSYSAKWVQDVQATKPAVVDGCWTLRYNLARQLLSPGVAPTAELAELRGFFLAMQPFFEAHIDNPGAAFIALHNEREGGRVVEASLHCGVRVGDASAAKNEDDPEHTLRLQSLIAVSPALQAFMLNVSLALSKIGPWSWHTFTERQVFAEGDEPSEGMRQVMRQVERERS